MHETWVRSSDLHVNGVAEANRFEVEKLITCVDHPAAEDFNLPLHNFICLNINLEAPQGFESHHTRLHPLAGDQPLVMEKPITASQDIRWPRISVVVCSYNGSHTIRDTLGGCPRIMTAGG